MILRNLFEKRSESPENPSVPLSRAYEILASEKSHSGASVTPEKALTVGAVFSSATLIAGTIGSLPLHVMRDLPDNRKETIKTEGNRFIWGRPNKAMTRQVFWETLVGAGLLWGDLYAWKIFDGTGKVTQLWPIKPNRVTIKGVNADLEKEFLVDGNVNPKTDKPYTQKDIFHVPLFSIDGIHGLSVVGLARESIGLALTTEEFGAKFFSQGSTLGGVIELDKKLDPDSASRLAKEWAKKHSGVDKSHLPAILDGGAHWKEIGLPLEDSQFLETRSFQVTEIARWFRVPPHLIGDVSRSTSWGTGIAEQNLAFLKYTLLPILTRIEQALTDDPDLLPVNQYVKFNFDAFLRGDTKSRFEAYTLARNGGWYSVNDIRELEDKDPIPGGDVYLMPLNMADTAAGNTNSDTQNTDTAN